MSVRLWNFFYDGSKYFNPPFKKLYDRTDTTYMSGAWKKVVKTAFKYTHFLGKFLGRAAMD